jgi:hypothetical protein
MSNFITDNTSLPDGKADLGTISGLPSQNVTSAEWNSVMQALYDTRGVVQGLKLTGTAPPVSGIWALGSIIWNSNPSLGAPVGWVCIAAGVPGTWAAFSPISGVADGTGTPGNVTQNTPRGRCAIVAGTSGLIVSNTLVTASSVIIAVLQTRDSTCLSVEAVIPASGSFEIQCNANATATTNVCWVLVN